MTTYIKVMAFEPLPDSDTKKNFTMYTLADGENFRFIEKPIERSGSCSKEAVLQIQRMGDKDFGPDITFLGNVYVTNAAGKTIATHISPWIHPDTTKHATGKLTREEILRPIMQYDCPNGKLTVNEIFRQTGRTLGMMIAAIETSKTKKVVVVVKDMMTINWLTERITEMFGNPPGVSMITYDARRPETIDWSNMKVTGKYSDHVAFIDHDVVYFNNRALFREYEKYNPPITVTGDAFHLRDTRALAI